MTMTVYRLRVEASAPLGVDRQARTVRGRAVPWGEPAHVQGAALPLLFLRGSLEVDRLEVRPTPLLLGHDPDQAVGVATWWGDHETGLRAEFRVSRTQLGEDMLSDAEDGIRAGLSVGADLFDVVEKAGVLVVRGGIVREVSVTAMPAFASARVGD